MELGPPWSRDVSYGRLDETHVDSSMERLLGLNVHNDQTNRLAQTGEDIAL